MIKLSPFAESIKAIFHQTLSLFCVGNYVGMSTRVECITHLILPIFYKFTNILNGVYFGSCFMIMETLFYKQYIYIYFFLGGGGS